MSEALNADVGLTCLGCGEKSRDTGGLFCSTYCKEVASNVRYERRVRRDGRLSQPDVWEAVAIRRAFVAGGLAYGKTLSPKQREAVFSAKGRVCLGCGGMATEIDHIDGAAGDDMDNLQPLCRDCNLKKAFDQTSPIAPGSEAEARMRSYEERVFAANPMRPCDDDVSWPREWRRWIGEAALV